MFITSNHVFGYSIYTRRVQRKTGRVISLRQEFCLTGYYYTSARRFRVHQRHVICFTVQYSNNESMPHCKSEELYHRKEQIHFSFFLQVVP
jgi:hypothetical protein